MVFYFSIFLELWFQISKVCFFFPSLLYNFPLNCDARPMFCSLNFTCMLDGAVGSLKLIWMLEFRMLWVPWTLLGCCNSRCGFCSLELTWVTCSIFVLLQHLHSQMLHLDLCFIFIFRVQTFTCTEFCTLRYIGI